MVDVQNFYNLVQRESFIDGDVSIFDSFMIYLPMRLLICPALSCNSKFLLLV